MATKPKTVRSIAPVTNIISQETLKDMNRFTDILQQMAEMQKEISAMPMFAHLSIEIKPAPEGQSIK